MKFFILSKKLTEKILFLVALIYLVGINQVKAQSTFYNDYIQQQGYYDSLISIRGVDSMQGTGYTQYKRWFRYWAPKLMPDLDYDDYHQSKLNYAKNYTPPGGSVQSGNAQWKLIGPNDMPNGGHGSGTGQIHYIYKDPHDLTGNSLFACSPVGGLFRTTNGGDNWTNAGTDKGLPMSGVSSVVVDSRDQNTWYVTTGNGESFSDKLIWQLSVGFYKTTDAGLTWEKIILPYHRNMRKVVEILPSGVHTSLLVTTTHGLFRVDNANTSSPIVTTLQDGQFYDVELDLNDSTIAYTSGSDTTGVFKINLMNNFVTRILDPDTLLDVDTLEYKTIRRLSLEMSPTVPGYLYAINSIKDGNMSYLYRYDINANKWVTKGSLISDINSYARKFGWTVRKGFHNGRIDVFGQDALSLHVYKDSLNDKETSRANCSHYKDHAGVSIHDDFHYLLLEDNDSILWAGTDGGVYKGSFVNDTTISWEVKNNGLGVTTIEQIDAYVDPYLKDYVVTSGQFDCGSNIYRSDNGTSWSCNHIRGGDGYQTIIINKDHYYVSPQHNITEFLNGNDDNLAPGFYLEIKQDCTTDTTLVNYSNWDTYYDYVDGKIFMTGSKEIRKYENGNWDDWSSFSDINHPEMGCAKSGTWEIIATENDNNTMYCSTFGNNDIGFPYYRIYKSEGGGTGIDTWKVINNQEANKWISAFETGEVTNETLYVAQQDTIFEVNVADPDSAEWNIINYNLVVGSINCIRYDRAANRLWIGTDPGIYYLDIGDTLWTDYSTNLPNVEVTDIEIKDDKIFVGTYGRGVWFASAPGCFVSGEPDTINTNYTIIEEVTKTYKNDIFVESDYTFTVKGTLKMGADCRIIVERGAQLIIDGGTITNACPDMWSGIEVWGIPGQILDSTKQGWVVLKNQAIVENAKIGVYTYRVENEVALLDFTGGIIQADSSTFRNNIYDVQIFSIHEEYSLNTVSFSKFSNCRFVTDSSFYFFTWTPSSHVFLSETNRVDFKGNTLENTCSLNFAPEDKRGIGIISYNSSFYVVPRNGIDKFNSFNGLEYGVKIMDFGLTNVKIDSCKFNYNKTGIYASGNTFGVFTRNNFDVSMADTSLSDGLTGMYLDACTGYQVEENEFYSNYDPAQHDQSFTRCFGLIVNNSGPEDNLVYNNYFHNIGWATIAQNKNRYKGEESKGLQYKCNNFVDNYADISVTWDPNYPHSMNGIAEHQGSVDTAITAPAGNFFSRLGKTDYSDFGNYAGQIFYHLPHWSIVIQTYRKLDPTYFTSETIDKTNNNYILQWSPEEGCPSNLTFRSADELKTAIASNEELQDTYADSLDVLVDAGNTTALNLDIATSQPPETMELRDELLSASPYLSDTVMVSAAEKEDVLPNSIITEVLIANPQSARSENVLTSLNERENPPNENEMEGIYANDTVIGARELLESKRAFYLVEKQRTVNSLIRLFMHDTSVVHINDSIEAALENINTPASLYHQAFCRFGEGDSLGVLNKLSKTFSTFELSAYENAKLDAYEDFFDIMLKLQSEEKQLSKLDSLQMNILYSIVQNPGDVLQAQCRNILIFTDSMVYNEPYILPMDTTTKFSKLLNPHHNSSLTKQVYIKLFPNPAKEYITLEYNLPINATISVVEILSISGVSKEVFMLYNSRGQKTIDLRSYTKGTYLLRLWSNEKLIQGEKFTKF